MTTAWRTALVAVVLLATFGVGPANADPQFRFWSLWTATDGRWHQIRDNPDVVDLPARAVLAWSFIRGADTADSGQAPRMAGRFDSLCPQGAPGVGTPVAVVIDYGEPGDAPVGEIPPPDRVACVAVADPATPSTALAAAAQVRMGEEGLVCGVDGYPRQECAAKAVTTADPLTTGEPAPSSGPRAWLVSVTLLGLLAGGYAIAVWRRR